MKRVFSMMMAFVLLVFTLLTIITPAYGEHELWDCPDCGRKENKGNYCGECGHPAPWMDPDAWTPSTPVPKPVIVSQPQSASGRIGDKVTFRAKVQGATNTTWQYYSGGTWFAITNHSQEKSQSTDNLTVTVSEANKNYKFRLMAQNTSGTVYSNEVSIMATELRIDKVQVEYNYGLTANVSWSGGVGPYTLACYHFFNENHNAGIESSMYKNVRYDDAGRTSYNDKTGIKPAQATSGSIISIAYGRKYWVVVTDSKGNSEWQKLIVPEKKFADFSVKLSSFVLKEWHGSWAKTGKTLKYFSASDIKKADDDYTLHTYYGFHVQLTMSNVKAGNDYLFGLLMILPNEDEVFYSIGFPDLRSSDKKYTNNLGNAFYDIISRYGEVPTGTYTAVFIINDEYVGSKTFTIK